MDIFDAVTHGCTPPLSSRGSCKPTDEYPYCTEGAMQLGRRGWRCHSRQCHQSCCLLLAHSQYYGGHIVLGMLPSLHMELAEAFCSELRPFVQLAFNGLSFYQQFWQIKNGRLSSSVNGTNRSQLKHPGRSPFNLAGLNKTMECFG